MIQQQTTQTNESKRQVCESSWSTTSTIEYNTYSSSTDAEQNLLAALAHGDINAFWPLWEAHSNRLYAICLREMNKNYADAEDALTQAMLKALQKLPVFAAKISHPGAWLTRLTCNVCKDIHRSRTRRQVIALDFGNTIEFLHVPDQYEFSKEHHAPVEIEQDPASMIDHLPVRLREVFAMRFIQELSYKEISIRLALTQVTVRKRIQHARATLRALRDKTNFENQTSPANNLADTPKAVVA